MKYIKLFEQFRNSLNENFYKWFENSKIVDENGVPKVVYHGSPNTDIENFEDSKKGYTTDPGIRGRGFYFTSMENTAKAYAKEGRVYNVYLKIEKPFDLLSFNSLEEIADSIGVDVSILNERGRDTEYHSIKVYTPYIGTFTGQVRSSGYDGILHGQEIIVFEPNQIKSVDNNGDWSESDSINEQINVEDLSDEEYDEMFNSNIHKIDITNEHGYALGEYDEDSGIAELKIITTYEKSRGKGHSRELMNLFINECSSMGAGEILLDVESVESDGLNDEQLKKYYASFGFVKKWNDTMTLTL
jgi:GNAT superfamily N-acetyltransferase